MTEQMQVPVPDVVYEPYRRGDLRQAFIDAAIVMVRERGEERFSLNELARKLGVSQGAAYRHFENKEALLASVCIYGYRQLAHDLDHPLAATLTPGEIVVELGIRYVRFAVRDPELFAMMFGTRSPDVMGVGEDTLRPLVAATVRAQDHGLLPPGEPQAVAGAVWIALHGIAVLHLSGRLATLGLDASPDELVRANFAMLFAGLTGPSGRSS